jgi:hypothetical protein
VREEFGSEVPQESKVDVRTWDLGFASDYTSNGTTPNMQGKMGMVTITDDDNAKYVLTGVKGIVRQRWYNSLGVFKK